MGWRGLLRGIKVDGLGIGAFGVCLAGGVQQRRFVGDGCLGQ